MARRTLEAIARTFAVVGAVVVACSDPPPGADFMTIDGGRSDGAEESDPGTSGDDPGDPGGQDDDGGSDTPGDGGVPTLGLVAWFALDGDAVDSAPSPSNGTIHGAGATTDRFSRAGHAMAFDGTTAYIQVPATKLPSGAAPRTLSVWMKTSTTVPVWQTTANWGVDTNGERFSLSVRGMVDGGVGGLLRFSGQNADLEGTVSVSDGAWHHGVATYDGVTITLYVDAVVVASGARTLATASAALFMGRKVPVAAGELFDGSLDDIRIYNRALPASEVAALFHETP